MSDYQQIAVRHEEMEQVGSVAVATVLSSKLLDEIDIRKLGEELLGVLDEKPTAMVVNFGKVKFMSSSSIGQLVKLWKQSKAADIRLVLTELDETLLEGFRVTHLDKQFEINTTEKRAIASLVYPVK